MSIARRVWTECIHTYTDTCVYVELCICIYIKCLYLYVSLRGLRALFCAPQTMFIVLQTTIKVLCLSVSKQADKPAAPATIGAKEHALQRAQIALTWQHTEARRLTESVAHYEGKVAQATVELEAAQKLLSQASVAVAAAQKFYDSCSPGHQWSSRR